MQMVNSDLRPILPGREINPMVKYNLEKTTLGRAILSEIYSDTQMIWGSQKLAPRLFLFDGEAYIFLSNARTDFINKKSSVQKIYL